MDWPRALAEMVRRATLEGDIKKPGRWLDVQLGYWERDHAKDISARSLAASQRAADVKIMVETVRELLHESEHERLERMKVDFISLHGKGAWDEVLQKVKP